MAAPSSSIGSATTSHTLYDVFLNFRGPDVKKPFAENLHHSLKSRGLRVFLDQLELQPGFDISSQIETAIRVASVHIAIFSLGYAESPWCLNELVLMLKSGATILPVYYNVKPYELRWTGQNKDGAYAEAFRKHEKKQRHDIQTIQNWKKALSDVSNISGLELEAFNGDEAKLLDEVVQTVLRRVPRPPLYVAKYPTGLDEIISDFERTVLYKQQEERTEVKVVGIVGSGGVGKTTLAKEIFNRCRSNYDGSSFLFDVRENTAKTGLNYIQNKLIKDLRHIEAKIESVEMGLGMLRRHLLYCSVLIVLDDVDDVSQLEAVFPIKDVLHSRSLILVTSRDIHVLKSAGIEESSIYHLKGLNLPQSLQLFCLHAFNQPHPQPDFEDLVDSFLSACNGLPLSLKVVGSLLCGSDRDDWEEQLDHARLPTSIQEELRISYDALHEEEKQIFLDVAYFFIGKDRDTAIRIWNGSGWNGLLGFQILQDRCLVEVDGENKIVMHSHLRDLGRCIVHDSQLMHRRLWYPPEDFHDLHDLLQRSSSVGSASIMPTFECVNNILDFLFKSIFHKRWYNCSSLLKYIQVMPTEVRGISISPRSPVGDTCAERLLPLNESLSEEVFGISKLQLLEAQGDFVESILTWVRSPNLLWLRWNDCPCSSLPSWIPMKDLRVLEVAGGKLERLWHRKSEAPLQLQELNIDAPLLEFPESLVQLKHLEKIVLNYTEIEGTHLATLPEKFGLLPSLKYLELKRCYKLTTLPESFGTLTNLRHMDLSVCQSLQMLPGSFGNLTNLHHIDLSECKSLECLPDSFGCLINLQHINMSMCERLEMLPDSFGNLTGLLQIDLSYSTSLKRLPISLGNLTNLQYINISVCRSLKMLPVSLGNLINLQNINLSFCESLHMLPNSFGNLTNLQELNLSSCKSLQMLPESLGNLTNLHFMNLASCESLQMLPDSLGNLTNLRSINLSSCKSLHMLPDSLRNMADLQIINLS